MYISTPINLLNDIHTNTKIYKSNSERYIHTTGCQTQKSASRIQKDTYTQQDAKHKNLPVEFRKIAVLINIVLRTSDFIHSFLLVPVVMMVGVWCPAGRPATQHAALRDQ
jgi:hypothetical protein